MAQEFSQEKFAAGLFDGQIRAMECLGCPRTILEAFRGKRKETIAKASGITLAEGQILFLPVIPRAYLGIYALAAMIRNGNEAGYTYLDPYAVRDIIETPKDPYFIYGAEDGAETLGQSPEKAAESIGESGRLVMTADECVALCALTKVLSSHFVNCAGSRYENDSKLPMIYLHHKKPSLHWSFVVNSYEPWGSPSCLLR